MTLKHGAHTGDEDSRGADAQLFCFKTSASLCFPSGGRHPQQPGRPVREEREIQGGGAPVQEGAGDQGEGRSEVGQHQQHPVEAKNTRPSHYIISLHGKTMQFSHAVYNISCYDLPLRLKCLWSGVKKCV